jgi:hypothetical protein
LTGEEISPKISPTPIKLGFLQIHGFDKGNQAMLPGFLRPINDSHRLRKAEELPRTSGGTIHVFAV